MSEKKYPEPPPIYYRILKQKSSINGEILYSIVAMQNFDEFDFHKGDFVEDSEGEPLKFDSQEKAQEYAEKNLLPKIKSTIVSLDREFMSDPIGDLIGGLIVLLQEYKNNRR